MRKRIYISADYVPENGDCNVVNMLHKWSRLIYIKQILWIQQTGDISRHLDCHACDLKEEFNRQINASSAVIFIVGDKTFCVQLAMVVEERRLIMSIVNVRHISKIQMVQNLVNIFLYTIQYRMAMLVRLINIHIFSIQFVVNIYKSIH